MRKIKFTTSFKKDLKRQRKRGKQRQKIEKAIEMICLEGDVTEEYLPHTLSGNWQGYRECHIEPDWIMIYSVSDQLATFYRTGTHADLF